jgi:anti-anti-sigma regulatory factor
MSSAAVIGLLVVEWLDSGAPRILVDVSAITDPDCGTVDDLARLQLAARRLGQRIILFGVAPRLKELVELAGLTDVLPALPPSGVEMGREAEEREEAFGVEEERDPADPPVDDFEDLD